MRKFFLSAICALIAVSSALASGLTASHTVEKEVVVQTEDGTTEIKYVSADRIAPGEKVLYSLNVANDGAQAATNLVLVMPVPDEVQFITGSAQDLRKRQDQPSATPSTADSHSAHGQNYR